MAHARIAVLATVAVLPLMLAACGGGDSTSTTTAATTEEATTEAGLPQAQTVDLACPGSNVTATVSNTNGNPTDVAVTWTPQASKGADFASYIVTLTSADGTTVRQVAKKLFANGDSPAQFIYDFESAQQTNLDTTDEELSELIFPDALAGVTGAWTVTGVVNVDGADVFTCS